MTPYHAQKSCLSSEHTLNPNLAFFFFLQLSLLLNSWNFLPIHISICCVCVSNIYVSVCVCICIPFCVCMCACICVFVCATICVHVYVLTRCKQGKVDGSLLLVKRITCSHVDEILIFLKFQLNGALKNVLSNYECYNHNISNF